MSLFELEMDAGGALWTGKNDGVPKGGLDTPCPLVFATVLPVLETAFYCPSCVVVFR